MSARFCSETTGNEADDISICALCSDTDASMKWNIREGPALDMFYLEFECVDENGSVVLETVYYFFYLVL